MTPASLTDIIADVVAKSPDWLRREMTSDSPNARAQAEETLSAMLMAAIAAFDEKNRDQAPLS